MRRTGLPAWDLRVLDPVLSYPSTILGRERAIVGNLEHIKAIVSANEVLVLNSMDPMVAPFVQDLKLHISNSCKTPQPGVITLAEWMAVALNLQQPSIHVKHFRLTKST